MMSRHRTCLVPILAAFLLAGAGSAARGQAQEVELWFYAHCDQPTDRDGDELFLQVRANGETPKRIPEKAQRWVVRGDGSSRNVVKPVFRKSLKSGEETKLVVAVLEKDRTALPGLVDTLNRAGKAFSKDKTGHAEALVPILDPLVRPAGEATDDLLAAFAITLKNVGGKVEMTVEPALSGIEPQPLLRDENDKRPLPNFRVFTSGANYHIAFWEGAERAAEPETGELRK